MGTGAVVLAGLGFAAGLPAPELAEGTGEVLVDQRGLAQREERRGVLLVDAPVDGDVAPDRVGIGEVRLVLRRARNLSHLPWFAGCGIVSA